jgi:hypothetical protein
LRGEDLSVEVFGEGARLHGRSIETRPAPFNAKALLLLLLGLVSAASGIEVPGSGGRLEMGGYLDGLAVVETEDGPRQRPQGLLSLTLDGRATDNLRGHLQLRGRIGGPFEGGHQGVYNYVHTYQNYSPALEVREAYLNLQLERADVRLGLQTVAWGVLDGVPPTDVINPRDLHDPFVSDYEERKTGVPAVLGTWFLPDVPRANLTALRASLVYLPIAVPPRLALRQERWFPPSVVPGTHIVIPRSLLEQSLELPPGVTIADDVSVPVSVGTQSHRPPKGLDAGGIGLRIGGTLGEQSWNLYHYTGPETSPDVDLLSRVRLVDFTVDGSVATLRLRARSTLRQAHDVIHMTGGDWSRAFGAATVRAEMAWFVNRPYLRLARDLFSPEALRQLPLRRIGNQLLNGSGHANVPLGDLFVDRDSIEWGAGVDYIVNGFVPLLQVNQIIGLSPAPRLIVDDPETRFTASVRKPFFDERFEAELRSVYTIQRGGWYVFPRLAYRPRDDLRLRVGYLAIGGTRNSVFGQFGQNDELVLEARYTF